jgi:hypothetical protein
VFVTSTPIDPVIIDYYLSLLPGIPHHQARRRLIMLSAYDASNVTLTRKILERPRLIARIRAALDDPSRAHLSCFNATADEKELALALDIPLYACDPALAWLGSKSGSRTVFEAAGVDLPAGSENLADEADIVCAEGDECRCHDVVAWSVLSRELADNVGNWRVALCRIERPQDCNKDNQRDGGAGCSHA